MSAQGLLLALHIAAGATALLTALLAFLFKASNSAHKWHVYSGLIFFGSMAVVFGTAVPLAVIGENVFLLFIGVFSFYLAWSGWRYARRRPIEPRAADRVGAGLMAASAVGMIAYGAWMVGAGDGLGIALAVFGFIGGSLCLADLRGRRVEYRERISGHLTRMLAAAIATITAFLVTNVQAEPAFVIWLAPTVVITPLIYWWNRKIRSGFTPRGMSPAKEAADA